MMLSVATTVCLSTTTLAVSLILADAEVLWARRFLPEGGLLQSTFYRGGRVTEMPLPLKLLRQFFTGQWFWIVFLLRLSASAVFGVIGLFHLDSPWYQAAYAVCVFLTAAILLRGGLGNNGSDQMLNLVLFSLLPAVLAPDHPGVATCSFLFIAAQLSLAYMTSAAVKLVAPGWRNGLYLSQILQTETFSTKGVGRFAAAHPRIMLLASWSVMLGELVAVAIPLLPLRWALGLLAIVSAFHVGVAFVMGLNTFLFAFACAYPATLYISSRLWRL